jgi:hypothetical protein
VHNHGGGGWGGNSWGRGGGGGYNGLPVYYPPAYQVRRAWKCCFCITLLAGHGLGLEVSQSSTAAESPKQNKLYSTCTASSY